MTKRVVVLGGAGFVGSRVRDLWADSFDLVAPTHADLDVLDADALSAFLKAGRVECVLNLAAWADVDGAEVERGDTGGMVYALNADYPRRLAELCGELNVHLIHVSTDYVFDGTRIDRPYRETDPTGPAVCWYAETKLVGEQSVLWSGTRATVARLEMPFSGRDHPRRDVARTMANRLRSGQPVIGVVDQRITPVFLDDAIRALRLLVAEPYAGVVHVAAADWTTPYEFARGIARRLGLDQSLVQKEDFAEFVMKRPARRPQHSWLDVSLFGSFFGTDVLRPIEAELDSWCAQMQVVA